MRTLPYRFWLGLALVGGITGAFMTLGSGADPVESIMVIVVGAAAGPLGAFLAGAVFFTVREERANFRDRHRRPRT